MIEALGMIEVTGYLGAISAADAALKAANVQLLRSEKVKGGITTIELVGDVAAITAAVDAGKMVAEKLNCLRASHVIARMDPAVQNLLLDDREETKTTVESSIESETIVDIEVIEIEEPVIEQEVIVENKSPKKKKKENKAKEKKDQKKK
ncbi:BMC domain-containing protein [Enterococcus sp. LJL99]